MDGRRSPATRARPTSPRSSTEIWWGDRHQRVLPTVQVPTLLMIARGRAAGTSRWPNTWRRLCRAHRSEASRRWRLAERRARIDAVIRPRLDAIRRFIGLEPSRRRWTRCSPPCSSPTSSARPSTGHAWAIGTGSTSSNDITQRYATRLHAWRGAENDTAGDGFYATFDGPARAIHCAGDPRARPRPRASRSEPASTPANASWSTARRRHRRHHRRSHLGARRPSQVLVSQTVKDLVAGTASPSSRRANTNSKASRTAGDFRRHE